MNFDLRDSVSSMVEEDLEAAELARRPQQATIYHYTDVKGALGILKSGELWFTERTHLNDSSEMMALTLHGNCSMNRQKSETLRFLKRKAFILGNL